MVEGEARGRSESGSPLIEADVMEFTIIVGSHSCVNLFCCVSKMAASFVFQTICSINILGDFAQ